MQEIAELNLSRTAQLSTCGRELYLASVIVLRNEDVKELQL